MTRRTHAFGLDLTLPLAVRGLPARDPAPGLPRLVVTLGGAADVDRAWGARDAQPLVRGPGLVVEAADGAYRLDWHGVGIFVLPGDGRLVCTAEPGGGERWERVLLAQVLPLAATVAGVEVLHASAVAVDGTALAIAGPARAGKSTLACALTERGADFLADDAVGLTRGGAGITVHPGPALARVAAAPDEPADPAGKAGREMGGRADPCELGALYLLRRADDVAEPTFEPGAGFAALAAATFNLLDQTPARLTRQLDLCADLEGSGRVWRAALPASVAPADAADLLARHLGSARQGR
ncbi:MAG TPA: hypothetical protein VEX39_18435 [Thermoleophilaceae bacterium]|nr:hypothetical protein [Thermoleophilaceae bacterium]